VVGQGGVLDGGAEDRIAKKRNKYQSDRQPEVTACRAGARSYVPCHWSKKGRACGPGAVDQGG
jgi:hypothetical protein